MLINLSDQVTWLRDARLLGLPVLLVAALACLAGVHLFLGHLPSGRRLYAVEALRRALPTSASARAAHCPSPSRCRERWPVWEA